MDESLEKALLDMEAHDQAVRNELTVAGDLNDNYHPRLEEMHRANASRLRQIIAVFGWPGITLVGDKGAKAAWRIALHSISEPPFMRQCRDLIDARLGSRRRAALAVRHHRRPHPGLRRTSAALRHAAAHRGRMASSRIPSRTKRA